MRKSITIILVITLSMVILACGCADNIKYRWFYISSNLLVDENVLHVTDIMKKAASSGYNGMIIADSKLMILNEMDERYFKNAGKIKTLAKQLGIDIIPSVCAIGYSEGILAHDPNLTEGLPVKNAIFKVNGNEADIEPNRETKIANGGFEEADGNKFSNWGFQDGIGNISFRDTEIFHSGTSSIRMEEISKNDPTNGLSRIMQTVKLDPYRQYHLSVWMKTDNFDAIGNLNILVMGSTGGILAYPQISQNPTQDWTQYHVVFNSLNNPTAGIYVGAWGGKSGKIWWDDLELEEVGLLNLVRREGCPFTVTGEDCTIYKEGIDYEPAIDERMGTVPWKGSFEIYHKSPKLKLTSNSRIKNGEKLKISFYHSVIIHGYQTMCCLTHPKVYEIIEDQIRRVNDLFRPKGFMMNHDEIRVANHCELCVSQKVSAGKLLADNVKKCTAIIKKINPKAEIFNWSDMFDPTYNAADNYYLANGTLAGSWEGLSRDVTVVNWNFGERTKESMNWFSKRAHHQILAGYYDSSPDMIKDWLEKSKGIKGIDGIMYTTWQGRYDDLAEFAKLAWGNQTKK